MAGRAIYDLLPTDTIRVIRLERRKSSPFTDGACVGSLRRHAVLALLRAGKIEVLRGGRIVRPRGWTPPPPKRRKGPLYNPWARAASWSPSDTPDPPQRGKHRDCMCCGGTVWSEHFGHRLCDRCRRQSGSLAD